MLNRTIELGIGGLLERKGESSQFRTSLGLESVNLPWGNSHGQVAALGAHLGGALVDPMDPVGILHPN